MILRLAVLVSLGCLAVAGPVAWDDSKCAQKCNGGSKYQYSQQTSYIYSYEASNELQTVKASDMSMKIKATVTITAVSKCEMVLEISETHIYHGPQLDTSLIFIEKLQRNPLPFAWNDGKIEHVCPNPEDSDEVNNIKKAILSAFQNTMRSFEYSAFSSETDILGTCDTEYKPKEAGVEKFEITKIKNVPTCSNYLKGQSLLLASFYQSAAHQQHLPFLSDEKTQCKQVIQSGIVEEVTCTETASFKPLSEYGYVVEAKGESKLKKLSSDAAGRILYKTPKKESLAYKYKPHSSKNDNAENEARLILRHICENSQDVLKKEAATYMHKLVYTVRQMNAQAVERLYQEIKSNSICSGGEKLLGLYQDALKLSSSGGGLSLLTKLATTGEMNLIDMMIWLTLMPFRSYVEEDSIAAIIPLLQKGFANRQSLLGASALTYKYCTINPDCESSQAVKDVSSNLKLLLGDRCHTENQEDETQVLTALKAFGNLGYVGESREALFECALKSTNKIQIRIAAIEAFRRSPCSEEISSKLLDIYANKAEQDEIRIAALISLSRCSTRGIVKRVLSTYSSETSRQVQVFTWSFLENLRSSSDPLKAKIVDSLEFVSLKEPHSTDITKFSRNFEWSLFSELMNLGGSVEANVIHSADSFLPRSGSLRGKLDLFGNQVEPIEVGGRVEDLEHILEKIFGPVGLLANIDVKDVMSKLPENMRRFKRSVETYQSKIEALSERLGYSRGKVPRATAFVRVLGHEMGLFHLNEDSLKRVAGFKIKDIINKIASLRKIDTIRTLLYIDVSALFPSITGRAYNLAANGSLSVGLKSDGKIDLRGSTLFSPRVDIDTKLSPSILADLTASFTIKSEGYEPGVLAKTVLNAGLDMRVKAEVRDGKLLHLKFAREKMKSEIFSMKRTMYYMNHMGQYEMPKPSSYNLNYCTKYLPKLIGAKYCASLTFPHVYSDGKPKIPFVRQMEMSLSVEQTDTSMDGYEFLLELPDLTKQPERKFRILFDTPNSNDDHKFAYELVLKQPDDTSCSISSKLHTPFYSLDLSANMLNREDQLRVNVDVLGDGRRRYSLNVDAAKVVKGIRLVEYQPRIVLSLPSTRPVEITGTLVFAKGRKEQLSVNLESRSFNSQFTIKGNLAKEGDKIDLASNWKLTYDFNANVFSQIHRINGGIGYILDKGLFLDMGHHYEPDGRSYESITVNAKVENIKIFGRLGFTIDAQVLFAEHQDLNTMLKWDFSFRPLSHLKSDFIFRYGENFEDDTHLVRSTIYSVLHGDFNNFHKMSFENKLGLTISCLDFDKSASLITVWDFVDDVKVLFEAGVKHQKDKEIKLELNYRHIETNPLKIKTEATFTYNTYKFKYSDEANEIAPREYEWKSAIEPVEGKIITTDFIYRIKSRDNFHHEIDGTAQFPGLPEPIKHKGSLMFDDKILKLSSNIHITPAASYILNLQLEKEGISQLDLATPFIEGNLVVDNRGAARSVRGDFKTKGGDDRRVVVTGSITPGDTSSLELDVKWDADRDSQKKVTIKLSSSNEVEDGTNKHIISGSVNYVGSINVDISGSVSTDLIRGPHFFRAEFSGSMEPMAIEIDHEIKDGHMKSVTRYLRSGVEKIRMDVKGKLVQRGYSHFEVEGGAFLSSPYRTFDGKLVFFRLMADSNDNVRSFISEYRLKFSPAIGYEGKIDYERKRGWPGHIKSNLLATKHNRPLYQGNTNIEYGNGKYSCKMSFTPLSKKKVNFIASFEHSTRFVAFHHSLATYLQYLNKIEVSAVADLRNMEDAKVHSNFDVNAHKLYDVNGTLKMKSMLDFDAEMTLFSKITPSLKIFSKSHTSGQITKYDMNLDIDSKSVLTGSGELKKKKRGFNGDIVFKYKEKEILLLTLNQDGKGKTERNYVIKMKFPSRLYTANIKVNKDKGGLISYNTKFCRNEELCVEIDATHKEYDIGYEWQITYRRDDVEFSIERIRESSRGLERFHTVIYHGEHRYGYDVKLGSEGPAKSLSLGIILPSREIITKLTAEFSLSKPRLQLDLSGDGRNHPDRILTINTRFENHLRDNNPSKLHVTITHPIFEKPIEIKLSADYEPSSDKFFTAETSLDYSNDPNDKLIGKLSLELLPRVNGGLLTINLYHKDEQHLDFVIKANNTFTSDEQSFFVTYNWQEDGVDKEAYMIVNYLKKEERFYFAYERPRLSYRLDGKMSSPETLLDDKCEMDLESVYNGESTKAKLVSDYETGCYKLTIQNEGELSRVVELCINMHSRNLLSLVTESFDDEGVWTFDYLLEIVQKSVSTLGIRVQVNPEFLGKSLFLMASLAGELEQAGVGTLPFHDSPQFQAVRRSFTTKVLDPAKNFIIPEAQKFIKDMRNDITFLREALTNYYHKLPSLNAVTERVQEIRKFIRAIAYEIWINIYSYYEGYVKTVMEYVDKFRNIAREKCNNIADCRSLVRSYQTEGWKGLLKELRALLLSLPDKIEQFLENPNVDIQNYLKSLINILKAVLHPLTKYKCGEIAVKVVQLSYEVLQPPVRAFMNRLPGYYRAVKQRLITNEYIKISIGLLKDGYWQIRERILNIDYQKLAVLAKEWLEDYLTRLSPPSAKNFMVVNAFNTEKGIADIDLHSNIGMKISNRVQSAISMLVRRAMNIGERYNWNTAFIIFKRVWDLNFLPPYDAQAILVGHQHYVTFDKLIYDFAGECTYLLSRDFQDGNFTIALKPKEGDNAPSILVMKGATGIEINNVQTEVKVNDRGVDLPYLSEDISISREGSTVIVDTKNGLQVKCNLVHEICTFALSGWYYGKTAGLLGTYNYEDADEFKRPKGQIANSVTVFAKSWELKRGCKTQNLVPEVPVKQNSEIYKECKAHFQEKSSPLSACFSEVPPEEYFQLCIQLFPGEENTKKSLCNAAAAYVMECEKNYVELNLPAKCLTCDAPDGSTLEHGDRKKFEKLNKKSADVVFIVEDHECNKVLSNELGNLARSIEKELQNEGFRDNMFGVVGFGGDIGDPQIFTVKNKIFFGSREINSIAQRLKLEYKEKDTSLAFEAIEHALTHLTRSGTSKSFVLLSCTPCRYDFTSLLYPVIQQILLERGISLHVIHDTEISVRKTTVKEKDIIGVDPDTVFHTKDVTQPDLIGEPDLRSQVVLPKDLCIALSQDVNGSFFSTNLLSKSSSNEVKNWRSVFARKFLKSNQLHSCQWCDCTSTTDHIPNTVCQPCEIRRPRLPFSVGSNVIPPRTANAILILFMALNMVGV